MLLELLSGLEMLFVGVESNFSAPGSLNILNHDVNGKVLPNSNYKECEYLDNAMKMPSHNSEKWRRNF